MAVEKIRPQQTATQADEARARVLCTTPRDRLIIELLWSTGLRRSELSRLAVEDISPDCTSLVVRTSKSGSPRRIPLSHQTNEALNSYLNGRRYGPVLGLSPEGIAAVLKRHELPSAHAWRRGWAVHSLRHGVSEASVRTAAGWSTGSMVVRYTALLSEELAIDEFRRLWSNSEV